MNKKYISFRNKKSGTILFFFLWLFSSFSSALPKLNGVAVHSQFGKEQFISGLLADNPSKDAKQMLLYNADKTIQLKIINPDGIQPRRFKSIWFDSIAVNTSSDELSSISDEISLFERSLSFKLLLNDVLSVSRFGGVTLVLLNGIKLGHIEGTVFFDYFLRIFISPVPLSSGVKDSLLQVDNLDKDLVARFEQISPSDQRVQEVKLLVNKINIQKENRQAKLTLDVPKPINTNRLVKSKPQVASQSQQEKKISTSPKSLKNQSKKQKKNANQTPDKQVITKEDIIAEENYVAAVKAQLNEFLVYPPSVKSKYIERTLFMRVNFDANGGVNSAKAVGRPKNDVFVKQAIQSINNAAPFPPLPKHLKDSSYSMALRVVFKVHRIQKLYEVSILD